MSKIILYAPYPTPTTRFIPVPARHVTIQGFEDFLFCIHRMINRDLTISTKFWVVSVLPSGLKVGRPGCTQNHAIALATKRLRKAGKKRTAQAFKDGLERVRIKS